MQTPRPDRRAGAGWRTLRMAACGVVLCLCAAVSATAQSSQAAPPASNQPVSTQASPTQPASTDKPAAPPPSADTERKKRLADESAHLLQLANDLKAEVDKTNKDMLSVAVIRKAEEIERLARSLKEKLKPPAEEH